LPCNVTDYAGNTNDGVCITIAKNDTCAAFKLGGPQALALFNLTQAAYGCISSSTVSELSAGFSSDSQCIAPNIVVCSGTPYCNTPSGIPRPSPGTPSTPTKSPTTKSEAGNNVISSLLVSFVVIVLRRLI